MHNHGIYVIAFSVASEERSRGDRSPPHSEDQDEEEPQLSADFVSKLLNQLWTPNKLSAQSGRRGASPPA